MRVLLLSYLLITSIMLSVVFHEVTHIVIDWKEKPMRACVPVLEDNHMGAVAYVEFEPAASIKQAESKQFMDGELLPVIISCVPVIFMLFLVLREDVLELNK